MVREIDALAVATQPDARYRWSRSVGSQRGIVSSKRSAKSTSVVVREHALRVARETKQELVFLLCELHATTLDAHDARAGVDMDRRRVDDVVDARPHAPQNRPDALDEA